MSRCNQNIIWNQNLLDWLVNTVNYTTNYPLFWLLRNQSDLIHWPEEYFSWSKSHLNDIPGSGSPDMICIVMEWEYQMSVHGYYPQTWSVMIKPSAGLPLNFTYLSLGCPGLGDYPAPHCTGIERILWIIFLNSSIFNLLSIFSKSHM